MLTATPGECDYALDFGHVAYDASAERTVKLWNNGTGNQVLDAIAVSIEVPPPNPDAVFGLWLYELDGADEKPVTLPFMLVAGDPTASPPVPPTELYARLTFTASGVDGPVPGRNLVLSLAQIPPGPGKVPISGMVDGCRPDHINCDSDPGCETACQQQGGTDLNCNGVDDDCNCKTDDGYVAHACGVGACLRDSTCVAAVEACVPGPAAANDTSCDGIDNDCDGNTDEDYTPHTCGQGICQAASTCTAGVEACTPGTAGTERCNGLDDNCDGAPDNGPIDQLCGTKPHAQLKCSLGECSIDQCVAGYFDLAGGYDDGCECQKLGGGPDCAHAFNLGPVADTATSCRNREPRSCRDR